MNYTEHELTAIPRLDSIHDFLNEWKRFDNEHSIRAPRWQARFDVAQYPRIRLQVDPKTSSEIFTWLDKVLGRSDFVAYYQGGAVESVWVSNNDNVALFNLAWAQYVKHTTVNS